MFGWRSVKSFWPPKKHNGMPNIAQIFQSNECLSVALIFMCLVQGVVVVEHDIMHPHAHHISHKHNRGRPLVPIVGGEWCPFTYQRNSSLIATVGICLRFV